MFSGFNAANFMPHGHCILWLPELLFPIVISDLLIFFSYTSIPVVLYIFQKKRTDLTPNVRLVLVLFFLFIQACGFTHLISAYNYWHSEYILAMFVKVFTAIVSVITAVALFKLMPQLLAIPSPVKHLNLIEELKNLNNNLEDRVREKTDALKEQNNLLETMVEGHQGAVSAYYPIYNDTNEIVDFSVQSITKNALEESGYKDKETLHATSLLKTFPEVIENGHFEDAKKSFERNETITQDPVYNSKTKIYHRVITFKKPDMDHLLVYFSDVTERENIKGELLSQSKLIAMGELAGGIAHEINTPLQVISGRMRKISRLLESSDNAEEGKEAVLKVEKTVDEICEVVMNLKRLARGDLEQRVSENIKTVVKRVLSIYKERLEARGIIYTVEGEDEAFALINEVSLFQIINNIITNAIDAMENTEKKEIRFNIAKENHNIILEIQNSGEPIPNSIKDKIFDPLFTTKDIGKGTGLGLSLSKKMAHNMGANISLANSHEVCFRIELKES